MVVAAITRRKEIKSGFSFGMVSMKTSSSCPLCLLLVVLAMVTKGETSRQLILFLPDVKLTNSCNDLLHALAYMMFG